MNKFKDYAEVVCNYHNEEGYWTIDAWKSSNVEEEGKVVAVINDKTAEVYYIDALARISKRVKEVVDQKVAELKKNERKEFVLFYCNENMQTDMERYATLADAQAAMKISYENSIANNFADREESYIEETCAYISSNNVCEIWQISSPTDKSTH